MRLKTALVLAAALGVLGTAASAFQGALAADLGRRPPPPRPAPVYTPPPPVRNWTGFYVGGFVGGAFPSQDVTVTDLNGFNLLGHTWDYRLDNSVTGGGTLGYNWQSPAWPWLLVGIEGEGGYLSLKGSGPDPLNPATVSSARIGNWDAMITGRIGWLPTPDWLLYVKGGAVWTELQADVVDTGVGFNTATVSKTDLGWTAGGGVEWMFIPQWSVKVEYLFLGFERQINPGNSDNHVVTCGVAGANFCWDHEFDGVHTVKAGLNYHF